MIFNGITHKRRRFVRLCSFLKNIYIILLHLLQIDICQNILQNGCHFVRFVKRFLQWTLCNHCKKQRDRKLYYEKRKHKTIAQVDLGFFWRQNMNNAGFFLGFISYLSKGFVLIRRNSYLTACCFLRLLNFDWSFTRPSAKLQAKLDILWTLIISGLKPWKYGQNI